MIKQLAIIALVATLITWFAGCAAIQVSTPYGTVGYDGKTVKLAWSPK